MTTRQLFQPERTGLRFKWFKRFESLANEAMKCRLITPLEHRILIVLAGIGICCGDHEIWPAHEFIAKETGSHVRSVRRCLERLERAGWVSWQKRYKRIGTAYRRTTNLYRLSIPRILRRTTVKPKPADEFGLDQDEGIEWSEETLIKDYLLRGLTREDYERESLQTRERVRIWRMQMELDWSAAQQAESTITL